MAFVPFYMGNQLSVWSLVAAHYRPTGVSRPHPLLCVSYIWWICPDFAQLPQQLHVPFFSLQLRLSLGSASYPISHSSPKELITSLLHHFLSLFQLNHSLFLLFPHCIPQTSFLWWELSLLLVGIGKRNFPPSDKVWETLSRKRLLNKHFNWYTFTSGPR